MAVKKAKKIDPKKVAKIETMETITELFEGQGITVLNGVDYGFTDTTMIIRLEGVDVQVKLVTPSAKTGDRYQLKNEE